VKFVSIGYGEEGFAEFLKGEYVKGELYQDHTKEASRSARRIVGCSQSL
jgi:hypothetical protein